jgi:hypothetical protein
MFQLSGVVVMSIAATRIHRSLTDSTEYDAFRLFRCHANRGRSRSSFDAHPTCRGHKAKADTRQIFEVQLPPVRVEVAVYTSSEDCPPPPDMGQYASYTI